MGESRVLSETNSYCSELLNSVTDKRTNYFSHSGLENGSTNGPQTQLFLPSFVGQNPMSDGVRVLELRLNIND